MIITCEHCGTAIDVEKNKRCPNCGASFARNKDYNSYKDIVKKDKEYDFREREADIKQKEITNDMLQNQQKMMNSALKLPKIVFIMAIIIFIIVFVVMFSIMKKM